MLILSSVIFFSIIRTKMLEDLARFLQSGISLLLHSLPPNCMDASTLKFSSLSCSCNAENNSQLPSENYQNLMEDKDFFKIMMRIRKSEVKIRPFHISSCTSLEHVYLSTLKVTPNHFWTLWGQSVK